MHIPFKSRSDNALRFPTWSTIKATSCRVKILTLHSMVEGNNIDARRSTPVVPNNTLRPRVPSVRSVQVSVQVSCHCVRGCGFSGSTLSGPGQAHPASTLAVLPNDPLIKTCPACQLKFGSARLLLLYKVGICPIKHPGKHLLSISTNMQFKSLLVTAVLAVVVTAAPTLINEKRWSMFFLGQCHHAATDNLGYAEFIEYYSPTEADIHEK